MIHLIWFTFLVIGNQTATLSLSSFYECSCEKLLRVEDCILSFCNWDSNLSQCSNKSCEEFNQGNCQGVPDPFNCIWNYQSSKCEQFKQCSDYSFPKTEGKRCYELIKCQADVDTIDNTAKTVKLMTARSIAKCDNVPYDDCEWLVTDDGKQCVRNKQSQTCETKTINQCSEYNSIDDCDTNVCYWNETCKPLECSKLSEESCQFYFSFDSKNVTLCTWKENQCTDLEPKSLKPVQCLSYTLYTYAWNPSSEQCEICQNPMFQKLLFSGLILMALGLN